MPASKYLLAFCESAGQGDHKNHSGGTDSIRAWVPGASDFDPCFSVVAFTVLPHFIGLFTMFVFLFCPQNGRSTEPLRRPLFSSFFMCLLTGLSALSVLFFKSNQIHFSLFLVKLPQMSLICYSALPPFPTVIPLMIQPLHLPHKVNIPLTFCSPAQITSTHCPGGSFEDN